MNHNIDKWEFIIKQARQCYTKTLWEKLFSENANFISFTKDAKALNELFKILSADSQCLNYDVHIWITLLQGCLSSWNLELGLEIANFVKDKSSIDILNYIIQIYIEAGKPVLARNLATKGLRLSGVNNETLMQFKMYICTSYVQEGKKNKATRILNEILRELNIRDFKPEFKAKILDSLARVQFFFGRYLQAAQIFYQCYELNIYIKNWEEASKSLYNTASCYFNAGGDKRQKKGFELVEECRKIAEAQSFYGLLSHVEAFYGHDDYWHGNFMDAIQHYRKAYEYIPSSDKSFRTLHILSMLTLIYFRLGQIKMAKHFAQKTFDLAKEDYSNRFKSRYSAIRVELLWEEGRFEESQNFIKNLVSNFETNGVNTLEELSTLSRYYLQSSQVEEQRIYPNIKVSDILKSNSGDWIEYLYSVGQVHLYQGELELAQSLFDQCISRAKKYGERYYSTLSLLGLIKIKLLRNIPVDELQELIKDFSVIVAKLGDSPLKIYIYFLRASLAYKQGDFEKCKYNIKTAMNCNKAYYADKFVAECWYNTIHGNSLRVMSEKEYVLLFKKTKIYFNPTFEYIGNDAFKVSDKYIINLNTHSILSQLLQYLLKRARFSASAEDIQLHVWQQSLDQQGWQQKIRNSIMRIRDLFPQTIAPLIIHHEQIKLFKEAINIKPIIETIEDPYQEILRLLREQPMSSVSLSSRLNISYSTTKRILKDLVDTQKIYPLKQGRNVIYCLKDM